MSTKTVTDTHSALAASATTADRQSRQRHQAHGGRTQHTRLRSGEQHEEDDGEDADHHQALARTRHQRAVSSTKPSTRVRLEPLTASRWVSPVVLKSAMTSVGIVASSPSTRAGTSAAWAAGSGEAASVRPERTPRHGAVHPGRAGHDPRVGAGRCRTAARSGSPAGDSRPDTSTRSPRRSRIQRQVADGQQRRPASDRHVHARSRLWHRALRRCTARMSRPCERDPTQPAQPRGPQPWRRRGRGSALSARRLPAAPRCRAHRPRPREPRREPRRAAKPGPGRLTAEISGRLITHAAPASNSRHAPTTARPTDHPDTPSRHGPCRKRGGRQPQVQRLAGHT